MTWEPYAWQCVLTRASGEHWSPVSRGPVQSNALRDWLESKLERVVLRYENELNVWSRVFLWTVCCVITSGHLGKGN
jgi:hypothetical protein